MVNLYVNQRHELGSLIKNNHNYYNGNTYFKFSDYFNFI